MMEAALCSVLLMVPAANAPDLSVLLPARVGAYTPDGHDEVFDRDTLFSLIDGGAEVYRALNLRSVIDRRYRAANLPDLVVDVFDMGSAADAYGAYHHVMREGPSAGIGQESELSGLALAFWKDRYFVTIVGLGKSAEAGSIMQELGRSIAGAIPREGQLPDLVGFLPPRGLSRGQIHFFHDWPSLERLVELPGENILELSPGTDCLLARYRGGVLLLVRYPSAQVAVKARAKLTRLLLPAADPQGAGRLRDTERWVATRLDSDVLILVLDAAAHDDAVALLQEVKKP